MDRPGITGWCHLAGLIGFVAAAASPGAAQTVRSAGGMVVSAEARATDVGVAVLAGGGNAFDAAVAVGFALGVTHPLAASLGGGGFAVAVTAEGEKLALDFREIAPGAAHRDLFLDGHGDVIPGASLESALASGVPGLVDGLLALLDRYGTMPRERLLEPAAALARSGVEVSPFLGKALADRADGLGRSEATRDIFFADGRVLAVGDTLLQPELARTLEAVIAGGRDGFYEGAVAARIVSAVAERGGILGAEDLRAYRSRFRPPLVFDRWGYEFIAHPLPSSGGITLAQILGLVDPEALRRAGFQSAEYVRRLVEAERLAYADRNHYLGDADFVEVPVEALLSEAYLARRRRELPATGAGHSDAVGPGRPESHETTNYCVADAAGNVIVITLTLNQWFGTGAVVPGLGIFLNNEMDDFSARPGVPNLYGLVGGEANAIAPGKRPLSSMTPLIVRKDGALRLAVGSPGGSTIITTVLQVFLNVTMWNMDLADAIDAGRFHHQWLPDRVFVEPGVLADDVRAQLVGWGYELSERPLGRATGILRTPDGRLTGHADRRVGGKAAGP